MTPRLQPPALRRNESVQAGLGRIATTLAAAAATASSADGLAARVHRARVILKRLRALLRLVRPSVGRQVARRGNTRLRRAAARLASARDAAVGAQTLTRVRRTGGRRDQAAVETVRRRFAVVVQDRRAGEAAVLRGLALAAADARTVARALGRARWRHTGWEALEAGIRRGYRRARRRFRNAGADGGAGDFHAWRTAAKSLLYQVGLLRPAAPVRLGRWLAALDRLQATLGEEHDLSQLDARLGRSPRAFGSPPEVRRTRALILSRRRRHRRKALELGGRLLARSPRDFLRRLHRDWRAWRC